MSSQRVNFFLYLVAAIVNFLSFSTGASITWIAPVLQNVAKTTSSEKNPFGRHLTPSEISWIAGLLPLGAALGPLLAGRVADKIGRKRTLLMVGLLNSLALIITIFAHSVMWFYIARFLAGVALGSSYTVVPMFLAEISENHNRGALGCSMTIFAGSGTNFSLIVGPYVSVPTFSLLCLLPLVLFLPSFFFLSPETPVFLASRNDQKTLTTSLLKLRNKSSDDVLLEVTAMLEGIQQNTNKGTTSELLKSPILRKGFFISILVAILPQSAGIGAILSFMPAIFNATNVKLAPEICVIIVGTALVVAATGSSIAVDRAGRKILLLSSSVCAFINLASLGLYFYLVDVKVNVEAISWLPVANLVVYIVAFNLGLGPVPWVIMAELFPSNFTAVAAAWSTCSCFVTTFIVTVTFPSLSLMLGMANCFFIFAGIGVVGSVFIWYFLPETKGKSLQEIQMLLAKN